MKTYARIQHGVVAELFETDGDIKKMFHSSLVWVECDGAVQIGDVYANESFSKPEAPVPDAAEIEAHKVAVVQEHMDAAARAYRYDDIKTACTYAEEPSVPKFQDEGRAFRAWRSLVWDKCYSILAEVNAGTRAVPADSELLAELPLLLLTD